MGDGSMTTDALEAGQLGEALRISARSVRRRADSEGWCCETRTGVGGKRLVYPISTLPQTVREAVSRFRAMRAAAATPSNEHEAAGRRTGRGVKIAERVDGAVAQRERERGQAAAAALTGKSRERMEAKLDLLARLATFAEARGVRKCVAMDEFCDAYNSGALDVLQSVRRHTGADLHPATLRTWRRLVKDKGPAALAGSYGNRKGSGSVEGNDAVLKFVLGVLVERPHTSARVLLDGIDARYAGHGIHLRSLQRFLVRWKDENRELFTAVTNPDQWKNQFMPAFGSASEGITRINQVWMLDSTPADLQLQDGRHALVGAIDVATRRFQLYVTPTSTAESVCQLMRRTIIDWGVPEAVKMDNGRDYASKRVASLLMALHVEAKFSTPFSPWEKPHIERAFRTFSHQLLELLPGYTGHNVAEAQAIRARESFADQLFKKNAVVEVRMTAAELQAFCDQWTRDMYMHDAHEGLGGKTPFQAVAAQRDVVTRIGDVRALDLLLGAGAVCTVQKKGVRYQGLTYIAPELASVMREEVIVRRDEGDLGRIVVYHREAFLCVAECPEVTGVSMKEIAGEARSRRAAELAKKKRELKALAKKANVAELAHDILRAKAEANASLTMLPAPNVVHMTPALDAASDAADALERWEREEHPVDSSDPAYNVAELTRREREADEDGTARFTRALKAMQSPGNEIEQHWLKQYRNSDEFQSNWFLFEHFGAGTFGLGVEFNALLDQDAPFFTTQGASNA